MKSGFIVLRFMLQHAPDGRLTQTVSRCGEFSDVGQAFDLARLEVLREWHETVNRRGPRGQPDHHVQIIDTEWGYELRRNRQVLSRYWVHDNTPAVISGP